MAAAREYADDRIRNREDLESWLASPVLSSIPTRFKRRAAVDLGGLITLQEPGSIQAEAFRGLRTGLLLETSNIGARSILVTSADLDQGTTWVAANLAVALAASGKRVVLISADLRNPCLGPAFGTEPEASLYDVLARSEDLRDVVHRTSIEGLLLVEGRCSTGYDIRSQLAGAADLVDLISAGDVVREALNIADMVLVCSPSLPAHSESASWARACDGVLLVSDVRTTTHADTTSATELLGRAHATIVGAVLLERGREVASFSDEDDLRARGTTRGEDGPGPVNPAPGQRIGIGGVMRIAVVGCGYWGSKHVRVLQALAEVDRVVAVDSRRDRLVALKRAFPAIRTAEKFDDVLGQVDAMIIATPPQTHAMLGVKALQAGLGVLIEKPLATSTLDARVLVDTAEQFDAVLAVGHTFEYNAAVWKLRDLVDEDELGRIHYLDSARLNLGLYQTDVSVVWDLAPHDISISNYVLRRTPTVVQAWGSRHAHATLEDVAYIRLSYEHPDVTAHIHVSWLDPCKVRRTTVVGSSKMAVYNDLASEERVRVFDKGVVPAEEPSMAQMPMSYRYGDIQSPVPVL